jgi:hypothetical protein
MSGQQALCILFVLHTNMNKQQILHILQKSRPLLEGATAEQKLKFLSLLKESVRLANNSQPQQAELSKTADYLEEK